MMAFHKKIHKSVGSHRPGFSGRVIENGRRKELGPLCHPVHLLPKSFQRVENVTHSSRDIIGPRWNDMEELDLKHDLGEKLMIDNRKIQSEEVERGNCLAAFKPAEMTEPASVT